jgi:hypothetical protein
MVSGNLTKTLKDWTQRTFLKAVGGGIPSLTLIVDGSSVASGQEAGSPLEFSREKFTPIDLSPNCNASPLDFGPREPAKGLSSQSSKDGLVRMPVGNLMGYRRHACSLRLAINGSPGRPSRRLKLDQPAGGAMGRSIHQCR